MGIIESKVNFWYCINLVAYCSQVYYFFPGFKSC